MLLALRAGIDDGDLALPDDVRARAGEGERAGIGAMRRRTSGDRRAGAPGSSLVRSWSRGSEGMGEGSTPPLPPSWSATADHPRLRRRA